MLNICIDIDIIGVALFIGKRVVLVYLCLYVSICVSNYYLSLCVYVCMYKLTYIALQKRRLH